MDRSKWALQERLHKAERIISHMGIIAAGMRSVLKKHPEKHSIWVLMDADSARQLLSLINEYLNTLWAHRERMSEPEPPIICLCGSTRFADKFNEETIRLTLAGYIVLRPEVVAYSREDDPQFVDPETKERLDELHLRKIDLADEVRIINVDKYTGESTLREIAYAQSQGKPVSWLEE